MVIFVKQPWFSFLLVTCPKCEKPCKLFFGPEDYADWCMKCREAAIGIVVEEFAPDDLVEWWSDAFDRHPAEQHKLTPRLVLEVEKLRTLLEHIPDDLLWSELTDPEQPHTMPGSWC